MAFHLDTVIHARTASHTCKYGWKGYEGLRQTYEKTCGKVTKRQDRCRKLTYEYVRKNQYRILKFKTHDNVTTNLGKTLEDIMEIFKSFENRRKSPGLNRRLIVVVKI